MTSSPRSPRTTASVVRPTFDADVTRAVIRARIRRQHRRSQRVLTRI
jgi:hypothetical protein